jgi:hypothetical protein
MAELSNEAKNITVMPENGLTKGCVYQTSGKGLQTTQFENGI